MKAKRNLFLLSIIGASTVLPIISSCASKTASRTIVLDDLLSELTIIKNDTTGIECTITSKTIARMVSFITVTIGEQDLTEEEFTFTISGGKLSIPKTTLDKYDGEVVIRPVLLSYFEQMRKDYTTMLLDNIDCKNVSTWLTHLKDDGDGYLMFDDLDYTSQDKSYWPAQQHLIRGIAIAVDAIKNYNLEQLAKTVKLTQHWLVHDYQNPNWWCVRIGAPRDLSDLSLFTWEYLSWEEKTKLLKIIRRGSLLHNKEQTKGATGTNLFWYGDITMKDSWLSDDYEEFEEMFKRVTDEIKQDNDEGFQSDGSYYQHGHILYNGGYGRQGAILIAKIMSAFANIPIQWADEKLEIITNFILKGLAPTIQNGYTDYSTMGRTYCRKESNQLDGGTTDLGNVLLLKYVANLPNCPHKDELKAVFKAWEEGEPSFNGINYLSKSNFVSMNIDGIYMSFKGTNDKMVNSEKINDENLLGYNLSYGTSTCVMETGKEYWDITPVWNYANVPGTTSLDETDEVLNKYGNETHFKRALQGLFGGGTIDNVTFAMQSTKHETTHYTVTCFATEYGMVLLGSNLTNDDEKALHTTVEQCVVNDGVTPTLSSDNQSVEHGNVVYTNINPGDKLLMSNENVTKSWYRNNHAYQKTDTATKQVLTITIGHTAETESNYAYCIQPKTKVTNKFKVAQNNEQVHAIVLPNGKIAAAFYDDSSFIYEGKTYSGSKGEYKVFTV